MKLSQSIAIFTLLTTAIALPNSRALLQGRSPSPSLYPAALTVRQSCAETCGSVCYFQSTIDRAVDEGCELYQAGETDGSSSYPHTFNNYEDFDFPVSGPYQEFPIMNDFDEYDGGSPGADRVVFNTRCQLAGVITHTGAGGNAFLECDG